VTQTLGFALAAGLVAALNPCGFAMLPAYLTLVVLGDGDAARRRGAAVLRALAATVLMTLGFLAVFGAFGLLVAPVAGSMQQYAPAVTVLVGAVLLGLGGWLLTGRELPALLPRLGGGTPGRRLGSMVLYGVAYAVASLSCTIAPFLAVTSATFRADDVIGGLAGYAAYAAGMGLLVGVLAVGVALAQDAVAGGLRRLLPHVNRLGGVLLLVVGGYVGYYGVYELRLYHAGSSAEDPIVDAAGTLQSWLVSAVDRLGWPTLLLALAVLLATGLAVTALTRRPHLAARPSQGSPRR
jgi:cytochrome c-type biogenesis protein